MSTNTELIAELYASDAASALTNRAGRAIEALEAQLKNASVAAIAEAAEVDRLQAEVERLTTLAHGQHIELYNARLKLAAAQAQEPVAEITEVYTMTGVVEWKAHTGQPIYVGHKLFAAPIPQQPAEPAPSVSGDVGRDAARWKQLAYMEASRVAPSTLAEYIASPDRLDYAGELQRKFGQVAAPQPKEKQ